MNALSGKGVPPTGQGIQALSQNNIDPTTGQITSAGSRVSSVTTAIGYVAATTGSVSSITFYWDGTNNSQVFKIGRDDGTVYGPNPAGSPFVVSGLLPSPSTSNPQIYFFYPYFDEALQKIVFASVPGKSVGTPPVAFTIQNFKAAQQQIMRGHIALVLAISNTGIATPPVSQPPNSGSGGTGGGATGAASPRTALNF